ncbi:oxidoreductase [Lithospermum erythrorhizon]|uniref:Oxidoreductase n=1 Tax=Lithospermum erythrorhizon TaxID=34254 RepID=A0AAV3R9N0_LITER
MAASFHLPSLQSPRPPRPLFQKSSFFAQTNLSDIAPKQTAFNKLPSNSSLIPKAKFNLYEILGGRGLCNGEEGIEKELKKSVSQQESPANTTIQEKEKSSSTVSDFPEEGFEKELLGLTGGFPGGEKGLQKFIEKNPPPKKTESKGAVGLTGSLIKKPSAPELPLLLPGMIAIVKNANSPYHMYCGIVQRITDGKAGVLFEGGNWDRLITFRLEELERREKGPPMVNPQSVILEEAREGTSS